MLRHLDIITPRSNTNNTNDDAPKSIGTSTDMIAEEKINRDTPEISKRIWNNGYYFDIFQESQTGIQTN